MSVAVSMSHQTSTSAVLAAPSSLGRGNVPPASAPMRPVTGDGIPLVRERGVAPSARSKDARLLSFVNYVAYEGPAVNDPRTLSASVVSEGIIRVIDVE